MMIRSCIALFVNLVLLFAVGGPAVGAEANGSEPTDAALPANAAGEGQQASKAGGGSNGGSGDAKKTPPHAQVLKDAKTIDGMIRMYRKGNDSTAS